MTKENQLKATEYDEKVFDSVDLDNLGFLLEFEVLEYKGEIDADAFAKEVKGEVAVLAEYGDEDDPSIVVTADTSSDAFDYVVEEMNDDLENNFGIDNPEEAYRKIYYVKKVNVYDNDGRMSQDEYTIEEDWIAKHMYAANALQKLTGAEGGDVSWPEEASCLARFAWGDDMHCLMLSEDGDYEDELGLSDAEWNSLKRRVICGDTTPGPDDLPIKDKWLRDFLRYHVGDYKGRDDYFVKRFTQIPKSFADKWQDDSIEISYEMEYCFIHSLEGLDTLADFTSIELGNIFLGTTVDLSKFKSLEKFSSSAPNLETVYVSKDQNIDLSLDGDVKVVTID